MEETDYLTVLREGKLRDRAQILAKFHQLLTLAVTPYLGSLLSGCGYCQQPGGMIRDGGLRCVSRLTIKYPNALAKQEPPCLPAH